MVLLCKSDKIEVLSDVLRGYPQQSIENARHFMPCTACMSMNCMRKAQAHACNACIHGDLTPPGARKSERGGIVCASRDPPRPGSVKKSPFFLKGDDIYIYIYMCIYIYIYIDR